MPVSLKKKRKSKGLLKGSKVQKSDGDNYMLIKRFKPLLFADFCDDHELVVVENSLRLSSAKLPEPIYRTQYGT